jgi:aerobic-type carbon monoxide dehydrogenase small subunit (CoxS/CutS family)
MNLSFVLNGKPVALGIEPRETLAEVLRNRLRLTGTKVSCEAQVCGSCTVLVEGLAVSSCTMLAYEVRGRAVTTIEGLEDSAGNLHPVQQAFLKEFAFQCGFCTPGMILAAKALLDEHIAARNAAPSDAEIIQFMDGNICRCTGYLPILKAVRTAAAEMVAERRGSL